MSIKPLIDEARRWYDFNHTIRKYHNWDHANRVANNCLTLTDCNPSNAVIIAAWWHDAVYVPGAGSDANERCSAAALGMAAKQIDKKNPLTASLKEAVNLAQSLIQYTTIEYHLHDKKIGGDLAILLDADLGSLADPYIDFMYTQENIVVEAGGNISDYKEKSAEFLHQFLTCREFIYHTDYAREHWEKAARMNIARYCNE